MKQMLGQDSESSLHQTTAGGTTPIFSDGFTSLEVRHLGSAVVVLERVILS
jgi:hypothetical protein